LAAISEEVFHRPADFPLGDLACNGPGALHCLCDGADVQFAVYNFDNDISTSDEANSRADASWNGHPSIF
jgi:hypothetical protein